MFKKFIIVTATVATVIVSAFSCFASETGDMTQRDFSEKITASEIDSAEETKSDGNAEWEQEESDALTEETWILTIAPEDEKNIGDPSLVRINVGYVCPDGSFDTWAAYMGFIINAKTVVTGERSLIPDADSPIYKKVAKEKAKGYKAIGVDIADYSAIRDNIGIRVYNGGGALINTTIIETQEDLPFTLLYCNTPVAPQVYFAKEPIEHETDTYVAGYLASSMEIGTLPGAQDVLVQHIDLSEIQADGTILFENVSTEYFTGGPVLDKDNHVLGIMTGTDHGICTGVTAGLIKEILNDNSISYEERDEILRLDTTPLSDAVNAKRNTDLSAYTEESIAQYNAIIQEAEQRLQKRDFASQEDVVAAADSVTHADNSLELIPEDPFGDILPYLIVTAAAAGVLLIFFFYRRKQKEEIEKAFSGGDTRKTPKKAKEPKSAKTGERERRIVRKKKRETGEKEENTVKPEHSVNRHKIIQKKDYLEEQLTIEDEEIEEETDLLNDATDRKAYLVRKNTGKKYPIDKARNLIGKDKSHADIYIEDNKTISRKHCEIMCENGIYRIQDLRSLNRTMVNGEILAPEHYREISDGSLIVLSNEEFIFVID